MQVLAAGKDFRRLGNPLDVDQQCGQSSADHMHSDRGKQRNPARQTVPARAAAHDSTTASDSAAFLSAYLKIRLAYRSVLHMEMSDGVCFHAHISRRGRKATH